LNLYTATTTPAGAATATTGPATLLANGRRGSGGCGRLLCAHNGRADDPS
jgi:hypothetical protein